MEQIVSALNGQKITYEQAINRVSQEAFGDVVPRFQTIGADKDIVKDLFYTSELRKRTIIRDKLLKTLEFGKETLFQELEARWGLMKAAFTISRESTLHNVVLTNDIQQIYLQKG